MRLGDVGPLQFCNDRLLVRKILIERTDVDACSFRDGVGGQIAPTLLDQNVSCCLRYGVDSRSRPFLFRYFPRIYRRLGAGQNFTPNASSKIRVKAYF